MKTINFAIIEDANLWRYIVAYELNKYPHFRIVLTCEWGLTFFEEYKNHQIDYLLLDINLPGDSGIMIAQRLRNECPWLPIIVFTSSSSASDISFFNSIGVKGYIHKSNFFNLGSILKTITGIEKKKFSHEPLTSSEIGLLNLVCRKLTNSEIAVVLSKSEKTVEKNLKKLCLKLAIDNNKLSLFEFAIRHGYWNINITEIVENQEIVPGEPESEPVL